MMMDTVATAYFKKKGMKRMHNHGHGHGVHGAIHHMESPNPNAGGMEMVDQSHHVSNKDHHHQSVDTPKDDKESQLLRYRIVAQV